MASEPQVVVALPSEKPGTDAAALVLKAAWLAIVLGIAMQVLTTSAAWVFGAQPEMKRFFADGVQKVSWSSIVCAGLAIGAVAVRMRQAWMGLLGLLASPIAMMAARSAHKGTATTLGIAPAPDLGLMIFGGLLAIKAAEYAALGALLAKQSESPGATLKNFLGCGLAVGVIFGGLAIALLYFTTPADNPLKAPRLAALLVNEIVFPIGCALVLYTTTVVGRRLSARA